MSLYFESEKDNSKIKGIVLKETFSKDYYFYYTKDYQFGYGIGSFPDYEEYGLVPITQLNGVELLVNSTPVSSFKRMVVGGLLFGSLGVLGGALSTPHSFGTKKYTIRLLFDDLEKVFVDLPCQNEETASFVINTLAILEKRYKASIAEDTPTNQIVEGTEKKTISYSDEIIKLKKLLDDGVIDEDEFKELKKKLIQY